MIVSDRYQAFYERSGRNWELHLSSWEMNSSVIGDSCTWIQVLFFKEVLHLECCEYIEEDTHVAASAVIYWVIIVVTCYVCVRLLSTEKKNGFPEGYLHCYLWCLCLAKQGTFCVWVTKTFGIYSTGFSMLVKLLLATSVLHVAMLKTPKGKNVSWVSWWWFSIF